MSDHDPIRQTDEGIVCTSGALRVVFDAADGSITALDNIATGQHLLAPGAERVPWRMQPQGARWRFLPPNVPPSYRFASITPEDFTAEIDENDLRLRWTTTDPGIAVRVDIRIGEADAIELWPTVEVADGTAPPLELVYPVLAAPQRLGEDDAAVFPSHSGWLIRDPLSAPPLIGPYPDGYYGCSVQCFAYVEGDRGGFYVATHDPHSTYKTLRFGADEASITHATWDVRKGTSIDYGYPVVLAPLRVGDWFEVAERYRAWALGAPWSQAGTRRDRGEATWLFDEIGMSIWCTPSSLDWHEWYAFYADVAETPLHIVAGWDWPATVPHYLGYEGWFPARFHEANLESWDGHYVTPYLNDIFISTRAADFLERWEPHLLFPYSTFSFLPFAEPEAGWADGGVATPDPASTTETDYFLCPVTEAAREFHAWRDAKLVGDHGMHGVFYDISSGNPMQWSRCLRAEHGHPPGRGRRIISAYEDLNRASKERVRSETGRYLVQGVETIIENVIGSMDFYVARACSGPMGALEAWTQGPEAPPGGPRELIPLFEAIYHDVGPVREDGWLTLDVEERDLFYWIVARIYLRWGGVFSMHYANIAPEQIPGVDRAPSVVSWDGATHTFTDLPQADPDKISFLRDMGRARSTLARYLGYGAMLRPVEITCPDIDLSFQQRFAASPGLVNEGTWAVPQVVHGAWLDGATGNVGLAMVNLHGSQPLTVELDHPGEAWGIDLERRRVVIAGEERTGRVTDGRLRCSVELSPRRVELVEITN